MTFRDSRLVAAALLAGALTACMSPSGEEVAVGRDGAPEPPKIASDSVRAGDCRLRAIRSYSISFPGISMTRTRAARDFGGWVVMEEFKEVAAEDADAERNDQVVAFATRYNQYILEQPNCGPVRE